MMHNFKKVFYIVCLLLLLLVCYQNSHAALISKGVTYKAEFKPFGDSLKWQHSIPAEFESPIALGFEFFLSGGTLTAELSGNMSFDSETHIIALQGTSGRMHSDGGVRLGGDITINTTIPLSTFGEGASLPINYKQGIPEFPDINKGWDKSETFNSFLLSGSQPESVTMEVGIPKLVTEQISAVRLGMILGKAIVTRRAPIPKVVDQLIIDPLMDKLVDYITEYVDGRIEVHGGLVGDLKLAGEAIVVNGGTITSENQTILAPDVDPNADTYEVRSTYMENFTYTLDFVADGNISAYLRTSDLVIWDYNREIPSQRIPILPEKTFDLAFTTNPDPITFRLDGEDDEITEITDVNGGGKPILFYIREHFSHFKYYPEPLTLQTFMAKLIRFLCITPNEGNPSCPYGFRVPDMNKGTVSDLNGIEWATNLERLTVEGSFSDLSPLAGLTKLTHLTLTSNNISDLSPLAGLTGLEQLRLLDSNVSDLSPIAGLTKLKHVVIANSCISDISLLLGLPALKALGLHNNPLDYTSLFVILPELKKREITGGHNQIYRDSIILSKVSGDGQMGSSGTSLSPFVIRARYNETFCGKQFTKAPIKFIVTSGDGTLSVEETTTDEGGRAQTTLTLGKTDTTVTVYDWNNHERLTFEAKVGEDLPDVVEEVPDVTPVAATEDPLVAEESADATPPTVPEASHTPDIRDALTEKLSEYNEETTTPVTMETYLAKLSSLSLEARGIRNLSGLEEATKLQYLFLSDNNISDMSALASLTELKGLGISRNSISDISALAGATNLLNLWLDDNNILDISALQGLTALRGLYLGGNSIRDITPLTGLTELRHLSLGNNPVSDISALEGLTALTDVDLGTQHLDYPLIYTQIPALQTKGVKVHFTPRVPTILLKVSGDAQSGKAGAALQPFVVEVKDAEGYPFAGVPVTFFVTAGDGTLSVEETETDADGRAASTLTLGNTDTTVTVSIEQDGIQTTFTARRTREVRNVYEKITGPWLWMIAPTQPWQGGAASTDIDSLAAASGGAVTETMIATQGANESDKVGQLAWTLGKISATGWDNVNDTVTRIGLGQGDINDHSSYALIILESATSQQNVPMKVGSDDSIKVWLNGKVVHKKRINRGASNFRDHFSVNLQQGDNILLVKVSERGGNWSMFVGVGGTDVTPTYKSLGESPTIRVVEKSTTFSDDLENLVLYLPFDEGTGTTATDSSKHQNHGTLHKANWTQGKYGNAVELSGERGGWVEVPDAPSLDITDEITLMAWVHPTQFTEEWLRIIVKTWASDTTPWMVYGLYQQGKSNGKTGFIVSVNGGQEARCGNGPSPQLPLNTWTHLAATYDGTRMKLYYNGELKVETSATGKIDTNDVPLSIGRNSEGDREHYIGLIDEVAIWRVALDAAEIKQAMEGDIITEPIAAAAPTRNASIGIIPIETALLPNYPNPFNPETWIPYQLAKPADVTVHIYAVNGTLIRTLFLGHQVTGSYQNRSRAAYWDGRNAVGEPVASGVYFYTLTTGDFTATRKMLIRK